MTSAPKRYGLSSHLSYIPINYKCVDGKCITVEPAESGGTTLAKCMQPGSGCTHVDGGYVCDTSGPAYGQCLNGPKHKGTQTLYVCKAHCSNKGLINWVYCIDASTHNSNICNYSVDIPWQYISTTQLGNGILAQNNGYGLEYILQPLKSYHSWVTLSSTISFALTGVAADEDSYVEVYFALPNRMMGGKTMCVGPATSGPVTTSGPVSVTITYTVEMTEQPLIPAPAIRLLGSTPNSKICLYVTSWTFDITDSVAPYVDSLAPPMQQPPLRYGFNRELVRPYPYLKEGAAFYLKFEDLEESYFEIEGKPVPFNKGSGVEIGAHYNPANAVVQSYILSPSPHPYSSWITFNSTIFISWVDLAPGEVAPVTVPVLFYFFAWTDSPPIGITPGIIFDIIIQPDSTKPYDQQYPYTSHSISYTMQMPPDKYVEVTPAIIFQDGIARKFQVSTWTFSFMDSVNPVTTSLPEGAYPRYALQISTWISPIGKKTHIYLVADKSKEITFKFSEIPTSKLGKPSTVGTGVTLPHQHPTVPFYTLSRKYWTQSEIWVTFRSDISLVRVGPEGMLLFCFMVDGTQVGETFTYQVDSLPAGKPDTPRQATQTLSITHSMWMTDKNVNVTPMISTYHHITDPPSFFEIIIKSWSFSITDSVGPLPDPPSARAHFSGLTLQGPGNGNGDDDSDSKWIWWALLAVVLIVVAFLLIMKRPWRSSVNKPDVPTRPPPPPDTPPEKMNFVVV